MSSMPTTAAHLSSSCGATTTTWVAQLDTTIVLPPSSNGALPTTWAVGPTCDHRGNPRELEGPSAARRSWNDFTAAHQQQQQQQAGDANAATIPSGGLLQRSSQTGSFTGSEHAAAVAHLQQQHPRRSSQSGDYSAAQQQQQPAGGVALLQQPLAVRVASDSDVLWALPWDLTTSPGAASGAAGPGALLTVRAAGTAAALSPRSLGGFEAYELLHGPSLK